MRRFLPKFLFCFGLFFGFFAYYRFAIMPSLSGEFGILGQIPFGSEYEGLSIDYYDRDPLENANVINVYSRDSLALFDYLTVGDSFSQYGPDGYQWRLSHLINSSIGNIKEGSLSNPIQTFVTYANSGLLNSEQFIIIECVERHLIERLCSLDFFQTVNNVPTITGKDADSDLSLLNMFLSWIRLSVGFDSPVKSFKLKEPLFTHPKFASTLFVYNSRKTGNGDLLWSKEIYDYHLAITNLDNLIEFAMEKDLQFALLIATDKYDAYEPWVIGDEHPINPTLSYFPDNSLIINTKPFLQDLISTGQKDIYKVNNTHWSVIGADLVSDLIFTRLSQN